MARFMFYVEIKNEKKERVYPNLRYTFHEKCYICEADASQDGETEHRIPVSANKADKSLEKASNCFWACSRCNSKKSNYYYKLSNECKHTNGYCGIIDCTKCDPNEYISIIVSSDLKVEIRIVEKKYAPCIENTVSLLRAVYCPTEKMDTIKLGVLKEHIIHHLTSLSEKLSLLFNDYIVIPKKPQTVINDRKREIIDFVSPKKPFFALKLSYIEEIYKKHYDSGFDEILEDILKDPSFHPVVDDCCSCFPLANEGNSVMLW